VLLDKKHLLACQDRSDCREQRYGIDDLSFDAISTSEVPEPASLALVGMGLLGFAMIRRNGYQASVEFGRDGCESFTVDAQSNDAPLACACSRNGVLRYWRRSTDQ
jgi:hypothetical protein